MIVADTSIIVPLMLDHEEAERATRARRIDREWRVPRLWQAEFANTVNKLMIARELSLSDADEAMRLADREFRPREVDVSLVDIVRAAQKYRLTAYDATFLALGIKLGVPVVTNDRYSFADKVGPPLVIRLSEFVR